ncbi:rhodanese-like domain-containing protein [Apibacter sp.]|uniref:rhodanese-like domain-containing protein n=1 Tax=Apibacter sp. TaxID=2023709 RepID=UPI0025FAFD64|nr:rhodanese-like domain-containing protein [Apibacter sp.]MCT6869829.1 rhodanese-like domain-containing protein [Apibacter sp.]
MNKLFLIMLFCLILLSCKSHTAGSVNKYTTPPEVGILITDLPRNSKPPASSAPAKVKSVLSSLKKDSMVTSMDTISSSLPHTQEEENSIQTLSVPSFSWEIGIRQTQIVDVRTLLEYKNGHIYDAINIGVDDPSFVNQIQNLDKNSPIAIYCNSGIRSMYAAKILKNYGFQIIYNLDGGLNNWLKSGKDITK